MTLKKLLFIGVGLFVLVNASIVGTLFATGVIGGGSEPEEEPVADAPPPPEPEPFKSKAGYLRSIGEAIGICEQRLHDSVKVPKSWSINTVESRYVPSQELYKIFLDYETINRFNEPKKEFNVICEVSAEKKAIELWKPMDKSK